MSSRRLSFRRECLFILISLLIAPLVILTAIEGGCRLFLPHVDPIHAFIRDFFFAGNLSETTATEGDPDLGWKLKADVKNLLVDYTTHSTDHRNFRVDGAITSPGKRPLRILCIGDSVTYGFRVPLTFPEHPLDANPAAARYAVLLQNELARRFPDRSVEVTTMAVPGYTTHQGLIWLDREIGSLQPELITILFGYNDTCDGTPDKVTLSKDLATRTARRIVYHSQALTHFLRSVHSSHPPASGAPGPVTQRVSEEDYLSNIREMVKLAAWHGAKAVVIGQVYRKASPQDPRDGRMSQYRHALAKLCEREKIPYLEVKELTEAGWPQNESLFDEDVHPNATGHQLLSTRLFGFLFESHLLGPAERSLSSK